MKKKSLLSFVSLFLLFTFGTSFIFGQKLKPDDIPLSVLQSFDYEYFGIKKVEWTLVDSQFVANFKSDKMATKAYFSNTGEWLRSTMAVSRKELPYALTKYVTTNFPDMIISESYLQQKPGEKTHYYIEVKPDGVGQISSQLTFTDLGVLMSRYDPPGFGMLDETKQPTTTVKKQDKIEEKADKVEEKVEKNKEKAEKTEEKAEKTEGLAKENVEINESSIPPIVLKTLNKKAARRENLKWYKDDSFYIAKCKSQGKENEIYITYDGEWEKTNIALPAEAITGNMQKHLKQYYKGYRFADAKKQVRADKKDTIFVEIYEKQNWKSKLKTTIIFDKTGKLLKTVDPDYEMSSSKKRNEDKDLDSYYAKQDSKRSKGEQIGPKDLPKKLQSYISQNYPSYRYKNCEKEEDDDLGEIYRIVIQGEGAGLGSEILYFDKKGEFLKSEKSDDEDFINETQLQINIPDNVIANFKSKYPRVVEPQWSRNDDGNYQVNFDGTRGRTICVYNPEGEILETYNALSTANITPTITAYIKKNYKKSQVLEYYSVRKADRKTYYQVILQSKKTKEIEALWFTNTGKFIEE